MKKLVLLVAMATTLLSCSDSNHTIKLPNGSLLEAHNSSRSIEYKRNDKVCVVRTGGQRWTICQDGEMQDTTYLHSYKEDGRTRVFSVTHKVGHIIN